MAERRMFAKTIVLSDAFLDMPVGARCLYMTMGMLADDDGFINAPRAIMRQCGATDDDMRVLLAKKFVLPFDNGVIVIKHWRINNYLRNDRYQETKYMEQKELLKIDENGAYTWKDDPGIPIPVYPDKVSIGKVSIGKDNNVEDKSKRFVPPTLAEVTDYCSEKGLTVNAERFIDYYESNGWKVGKNPMKDWRATLRNWSREDKAKPQYNAEEMQAADVDLTELSHKMFGGQK